MPSPSGSALSVRRGSILSCEPSSTMPEGVTTRPPALAASRSGSAGFQAHFIAERADQELADGDRAAFRKERPHAQISVHAADLRVSTLPSGLAVIEPNGRPWSAAGA